MALQEPLHTTPITTHSRVVAAARRDWRLLAATAVSLVGYLGWFFTLHFRSVGWAAGQVLEPLSGYWTWFYRHMFSADQVFAARRSALAAGHPALQVAAWLVIVAGYLGVLLRLRAGGHLRLRALVGLALLVSAPLLLTPNLLSGDVYSYISFGRLATLYGKNPFIDPPSIASGDPFFRWVNWTGVPSVYGPG